MSGLLLNVWAMGKKKAANEEMLTECQLKQCGARAYTGGGGQGGSTPLQVLRAITMFKSETEE